MQGMAVMRGIRHLGLLDDVDIGVAQLLKDELARFRRRVLARMNVGQQLMRRVGINEWVRQRGTFAAGGTDSSIQQAHQHGVAQLWVLRNVDVIIHGDGDRLSTGAGQP